jgi:hypothetical protein
VRVGVTLGGRKPHGAGRAIVLLIWHDWDGSRVAFGIFTYHGHHGAWSWS